MLFGFIEFGDLEAAKLSYTLSGISIGGYPLRIDHSNTPVVQPTAYGPGMAYMKKEKMRNTQRSEDHKLDSILSKINDDINDRHSSHRSRSKRHSHSNRDDRPSKRRRSKSHSHSRSHRHSHH